MSTPNIKITDPTMRKKGMEPIEFAKPATKEIKMMAPKMALID